MGELFILLNAKDDLIYKFEHNLATISEFFHKFLLAYSSMDILRHMIETTDESFIPCITKNKKSISALIMRSGVKVVMVTEKRKTHEIRQLAMRITEVLKRFFVDNLADFFERIEDEELDKQIAEVL